MHHTAAFGLGFDEVDALTGSLLGRPKSATYRTSDVVGLDTMSHVIKTMADTLPNDPWKDHFKAPDWLQALIAKGALGQKPVPGFRNAVKRSSCWICKHKTIAPPQVKPHPKSSRF